jgi:hypothetical protein
LLHFHSFIPELLKILVENRKVQRKHKNTKGIKAPGLRAYAFCPTFLSIAIRLEFLTALYPPLDMRPLPTPLFTVIFLHVPVLFVSSGFTA